MKSKLFIIGIITLLCGRAVAQEKTEKLNQRDSALPMNNQHNAEIKNRTSLQQQKQKKVQSAVTQKKKVKNKKNGQKEKNKLSTIITPEQKKKRKEKSDPHRGVTNMPNERTGK